MSLKNTFTLLIPTYNRYSYLLRLLKYYKSFGFPFDIHILDSSSDELASKELEELIKHKTVHYHKYDSNIFFANKIALGTEYIKTPYSALCGDDDFLIPVGIISGINFLQENLDYASAHGMYFLHNSYIDSQIKGFTFHQIYKPGISANLNNPTKRVETYLNEKIVYPIIYAIHRTELFIKIWDETRKYVSDWGLSEVFPCLLSLIYGKMKVLPVFYSSREPNTSTWYSAERYMEMFSEQKIDSAAKGISKHLSAVNKLSENENIALVKNSFHSYLSKIRNEKLELRQKRNFIVLTLVRIRSYLSLRIRIRKIFLAGCHPSIFPKYFIDYMKVRQYVMNTSVIKNELNESRKQYN